MAQAQPQTLRRALNLPLLTLYGLGTIVGAGIYVLVGKVAATAGVHAPIAFFIAAAVAGLSGVAYAELSARFPKSGGEAVYVRAAFHRRWFASLVGWSVVITGTVSAAAITNGFVGYVSVFATLPGWVVISALAIVLGAIAIWGIGESVMIAAIITVVEIGGLLLVVVIAAPGFATFPERWPEFIGLDALANTDVWSGILLGTVLAFYAFIGFEDIVNVAEEVKNPRKTLPRAIFLSIVVSSVLYVFVALAAVLTVPLDQLSESSAPLAEIAIVHGHDPRFGIGLISLLAVTNGALIQIIMASRVIYGLALEHGAPATLAHVHERFRTPARATVLVVIAVWALASWFPIENLARATSVMTLTIFATINFTALWLRRTSPPAREYPQYPWGFPAMGLIASLALLMWQLRHWLQ